MGISLLTRAEESRDRALLVSLFSIDLRALAVLRIGLGVILIYDAVRSIPLSGDGFVGLWPLLVLPFAVALVLGYQTRLATVLCWLVFGLPIRQDLLNPEALAFLGRYTLALLLFWGIFLPLGSCFSLDARSRTRNSGNILSIASGALLAQLFLIYLWSGINKDLGEWVFDATAIRDVLNSSFGNDLGRLVARFSPVTVISSVGTIVLEVVGSILLFVPGKNLAKRRTWLVAAFVAFHLGMALLMNLGIFPFVMITAWLLFLPGNVWDKLLPGATEPETVVDRNLLRNVIAAAALAYVMVSNFITWAYFPAETGFVGGWQRVGVYLLLYQQWAMFSLPSTLW
jgi:hypothetical protein